MAEGLRLRLGSWGSDESCLGLGRRGRGREEGDLFADGAAKVLESLLDVRRVVVGLVRILRALGVCLLVILRHHHGRIGFLYDLRHSKHLLVSLLEGVHSLLKVDVIGR